jgi:hypothetical protein
MSVPVSVRRRQLRIPDIPRFAPGLALLTGVIGFALGAESHSEPMLAGLAIAGMAAIGLIASAGLDRSERMTRIRRHDASAEGARLFGRELARARRHETPLTVVRLPGAAGLDEPSDRRNLSSIRRQLRRIDVVWIRGRDVLLLLPETDGLAAAQLLGRLRERVPTALAVAEPTIAAFPGDGLTAGALLAVLEGRPPLGPAPSPTPSPLIVPAIDAAPANTGTGGPLLPPVIAGRVEAGEAARGPSFSAMSVLVDPLVDRERAPTDFA